MSFESVLATFLATSAVPIPHPGWWLADLALRGTVLLAAVLAMLAIARHRSAAHRHLIGMVGLLAMPLLPLAMIWLPAEFGVLPSFFASAMKLKAPGALSPAAAAVIPTWIWAILLIWLTVGLVHAARAFTASHRLHRFFDGGKSLQRAEASLLSRQHNIKLSTMPQVRMSDAVDVPITFGLIRSKILLPSEAETWDEDRLNWVLLHEQAHIARRDSAAQAATIVTCSLFWWQPLVWRLSRRLELEREHAADDLVLAHSSDAVGYARLLIDIADGLRGGRPITAFGLPMARPSQLSARLNAMLDSKIDRRRTGPMQALFALSALGALLILLAAMPGNTALAETSGLESTELESTGLESTELESTGLENRGLESGGPESRATNGHEASRGHEHNGHRSQMTGHSSARTGHASGDHGSSPPPTSTSGGHATSGHGASGHGHSGRTEGGHGHSGRAEGGHGHSGHQSDAPEG